MNYGLILGALFSLNFLFSTAQNSTLGLLSYVIWAAILYLTYRFATHYRDTECQGSITFGKSLSYILLLYFFGSLLSAVVKIVYLQFINPTYLTDIMAQTLTLIEGMGMTVTDEMVATTETMLKPVYFSLQYIWVNLLGGFFVGIIMAALVKKEPNPFSEA